MSYPPRPPIGVPGMMTQGYGFPISMMPMGVGMMAPPTMMRPLIPTTTHQATKQTKKALIPQDIPKDDKKDEKPPVTTVFVGNISERAPDMMVKQMLQRCGNVLSWKRVQGANGKLQAFGFCEYEQPEATLRCIRLLNEWQISDKKLVVKVDAKTNVLLDEYLSKRNKKNGEKASTSKGEDEKDKDKEVKKEGEEEKEDLDEFTKREDRVARAGLEAIMREYAIELAKAPNGSSRKEEKESKSSQKKKEEKEIKDTGFDDMDLEDDKREIINREIKSFRDLHKDEDEQEKDRQREKERRIEEKRRRDREKERDRERERERQREREREREREKSFERERTRSRSRSRSSSRGRSRRRERSRSRERSRDRSRERRKEREQEAEEEEYERRKLEKKLREKEAAYQERLKQWELRERKRAREYEKEATREEERKNEENREARRLKEFLEDYDDLRDDPKFYKGSELSRRLKEREKEKEADTRDRQREKEEFEEIRRKLLEEGHPDIEGELARMESEREEHLKPRLQLPPEKSPSPPPQPQPQPEQEPRSNGEEGLPEMRPLQPSTRGAVPPPSAPSTASPGSEEDSRFSLPGHMSEDSSQTFAPAPVQEEQTAKFGFSGLKLGSNSPADAGVKRKKITVGDVFNNDEEETSTKRRKLMPLDYDDDKTAEKKPSTAEEKRQKIKHLIESIPTAKNELFAYPLDWNIVDQSLMDKRIKPWVNKKIVEYIGEEEPQLTEFICQKVIARSTPQRIQDDVAMILDEEAEVFVVKMWRLLVYETEAKKLGLVK